MKKVGFSVIVPVYNVEKYIGQCIDSILNQKDSKLEIILVDDGSTDKSGLICDKYASRDMRIKVIHQENSGLSDARNKGAVLARNEYLLFVDSDDFIAENSLKNIENIIYNQNYPEIVFLECKKMYGSKFIPMNDGINSDINSLVGDQIREYISDLPKYPASACTKAIDREFFLDNNLFFKKGILCEDLDWAVKLFLSVDRVAYCQDDYYYYRQNRANSISGSFSKKKIFDVSQTVVNWSLQIEKESNLCKQKMIKSLMEYVFRFLLIGESQLRDGKQEIKNVIKKVDWILGNRRDKVSKCIRLAYNILGIDITGKLLVMYLKYRDR